MPSRSEGFRKLARPSVLILLGALAFGGYVAWLTLDTVRQAPAREASAELPGFGLVRLRFTTDPFPALPTGTVRLTFTPSDPRNTPLVLDRLSFTFGRRGSDEPDGGGEAQPTLDGTGTYTSGVQFATAGEWWIRVHLERAGQQAQFAFTVLVEPAQ